MATGNSLADAKAFYKVNSGMSYEVERASKMSEALSNPAQYYKKRQEAYVKLEETVATIFENHYKSLHALKIPEAKCVADSTRIAETMRVTLMADLEAEYPSNVTELALSGKFLKGGAGKTNFAVAEIKAKGRGKK